MKWVCLMNVLWLVFGGIPITAVEYMIASLLLMMITIVWHSFRYANNEDGGACPVAFRQRGAAESVREAVCTYWDECVVDFLGGIWICLSHLGFGVLLYHRHRYSFRDAAFQTCRFGVGAFRERYCGIITSYYPV